MKKNLLILFVVVFVFLSVNISHAFAATLYFHGGNFDWNNLGNWWTDAGFSSSAGSLPGISDDVIITTSVLFNGGPAISVHTATFTGSASTIVNMTVSNGAFFHNSSSIANGRTISGDATFYDTSYSNGNISGNATFNNSSYLGSSLTVSGNATFNDLSFNNGTVSGDATFTSATGGSLTLSGSQAWGNVHGTARDFDGNPITQYIFTDFSVNYGSISGDATFYNSSNSNGSISGDVIFFGTSCNNGSISGDVIFHDGSCNNNIITGNATFNDISYNQGNISGNAIYNYASSGVATIADGGIWGGGTALANLGDDDVPLTSWIFNGTGYNAGAPVGNAIFNGMSHNDGILDGNATFNDESYNFDSVTGNAIFNGASYNNDGIVEKNATFNDTSANNGEVDGNACFAKTATNNGTVGGKVTVCGAVAHKQYGSSAAVISNFFANNQTPYVSEPNVVIEQPLVFHFVKNIRSNTNSIDVQNLQKYLNSHGFLVSLIGPGSAGNETTFFGPKTKMALILFQKSKGLVPDGIVGPKTIAVL